MKRRILLIDDNPNDLELALAALEDESPQWQPEVSVAGSGAEALEMLHSQKADLPDLILLDLKMPHMDGLAVLDAIRTEEQFKKIPVVMLTTSGEDRDIHESYAHGASAYVVKPLDFEQFRTAMQTIRAFWMNLNHPPRFQ